jgi:hypothetical protein
VNGPAVPGTLAKAKTKPPDKKLGAEVTRSPPSAERETAWPNLPPVCKGALGWTRVAFAKKVAFARAST